MSPEREAEAGPPEEIEVKIPCDDLEAVRNRLRAEGAALRAPLHDESNDLYDDLEGRLRKSGRALRLRRAQGGAILTFKGPSRFQDGIKRREEREVRVSDPGQAHAILEGLGFRRRFRYEKKREEWALEECVLALDETPIGRFVEVEGSPPAIRRLFVRLGFDFSEAVPYSYADLYARKRREDPSLPDDMVFERP